MVYVHLREILVSLLRLCTIHALYMVACLAGFRPVFKFKYQAQTMSSNLMVRARVIASSLFLGLYAWQFAFACTTAVISGKVTHDGRPILWKNRDTSFRHNELVLLEEGRYRALAVVNAGSRKSVWMGVNEAGLCIENSLSKDLGPGTAAADGEKKSGPGNGGLMKLALQTCVTVADFKKLLEQTDETGRQTNANFGVIDAHGGAAMFEAGASSHVMFDANDPKIAPHGYLIRTNFATTARSLPPSPQAAELKDIYSAERFAQACARLEALDEQSINVAYILRNMARDLSLADGRPHAGTVNGLSGEIPDTILTDSTISRTTTVSAAVFHGVRQGEDPVNTTMWTMLGDPKFSIAVPCWVNVKQVGDAMWDPRGGELGEIAITLREWCLNATRDGVNTEYLPGIWNDLWPVEDTIFSEVSKQMEGWRKKPATRDEMTVFHKRLTGVAMQAMEKELLEMKGNALALKSPTPPEFEMARIAIYDHSNGSAKGPQSLMRFLTGKNGFHCERVTPSEIREGCLSEFDALVMPGGSGSLQSKKLEARGRSAVQQFVRGGGGYIGICAGSYLASSHYDWSLDLINARVWDRSHWARGQGTVALSMTAAGRRVLNTDKDELDVYYGQGPLLVPDNDPDLPGYQVLARYQSEVALKGAQPGAMSGTHAIIRSMFGEGRVICFSPHPEKLNGPNGLMLHGVRWAAGSKLDRQSAPTSQAGPSGQQLGVSPDDSKTPNP